jgi:hypothetical protein
MIEHLNKLFDHLDAWRHLPSYQLERRADIFFSIYLPEILTAKFGVEIEGLIPEFPVRIGTIDQKTGTNQSFKIDYLARVKGEDKIYFVELKTDRKSRRHRQDWYLEKSREAGMVKLLEGLQLIYQATSSKDKYRCLYQELEKLRLLSIGPGDNINITHTDYDIEIVYIQPTSNDQEPYKISFNEAAEIISQGYSDELSIRFAKSLREWASLEPGLHLNENLSSLSGAK